MYRMPSPTESERLLWETLVLLPDDRDGAALEALRARCESIEGPAQVGGMNVLFMRCAMNIYARPEFQEMLQKMTANAEEVERMAAAQNIDVPKTLPGFSIETSLVPGPEGCNSCDEMDDKLTSNPVMVPPGVDASAATRFVLLDKASGCYFAFPKNRRSMWGDAAWAHVLKTCYGGTFNLD